MLTIKAIDLMIGQEGSAFKTADVQFENDLINFVVNELKKRYQVVASPTTITNAPGAGVQKGGGCLVMMGFFGLLAAGSGFGGYILLATLLP